MVIKKTTLVSSVAILLLSVSPANAQTTIQVIPGEPVAAAVYTADPVAAPVYYSTYPDSYDPQHRRHDFEYWQRVNNHTNGSTELNHDVQAHN